VEQNGIITVNFGGIRLGKWDFIKEMKGAHVVIVI